jgi:hypothetical protein
VDSNSPAGGEMKRASAEILTMLIPVFLILTACGNDTTGITPPVLPHDPVNEGWKAIDNYEYAYNTMDTDLLAVTLDNGFLHHLLEENWDDYNGDGVIDSTWGYNLELTFAEGYFSAYDCCEFTLTGEDQYTWPEDPSGESIAYPRSYLMRFYKINPSGQTGFTETGEFILVCKPDSSGNWHLTHLIDL